MLSCSTETVKDAKRYREWGLKLWLIVASQYWRQLWLKLNKKGRKNLLAEVFIQLDKVTSYIYIPDQAAMNMTEPNERDVVEVSQSIERGHENKLGRNTCGRIFI